MDETNDAAKNPAGWRFNVGIAMIGLMALMLCLIPLSAAVNASAATVATITGLVFVGNKVLLLIAIAVLGKSGFQELKRRIFGSLKPEPMVGVMRYRIGLVMFVLPLLTAVLEPYVDNFLPGIRPHSATLQFIGDAMFIGSFFVLGGNFWDKVRALFVRTATAVHTR